MVFEDHNAHRFLKEVRTPDEAAVIGQGGYRDKQNEARVEFRNSDWGGDPHVPDHHTGIVKQRTGIDVVNQNILALFVRGNEVGRIAGSKGYQKKDQCGQDK